MFSAKAATLAPGATLGLFSQSTAPGHPKTDPSANLHPTRTHRHLTVPKDRPRCGQRRETTADSPVPRQQLVQRQGDYYGTPGASPGLFSQSSTPVPTIARRRARHRRRATRRPQRATRGRPVLAQATAEPRALEPSMCPLEVSQGAVVDSEPPTRTVEPTTTPT